MQCFDLTYESNVQELQEWCKNNCKGDWFISSSWSYDLRDDPTEGETRLTLAFKSEKDELWFKLRWL